MRAKVTCMRCGKFWFADEPEFEPLCPICEDAYQEWLAAESSPTEPVEPEGDR